MCNAAWRNRCSHPSRLPQTLGLFEFTRDLDYTNLVLGGTQGMLTAPQMIPVYKRLLAAAEEQQRFGSVVA